MNLNDFYSQRIHSLEADIALLKNKNRIFIAAELISFCIALAFFAAYCTKWHSYIPLVLAVVFIAVYVVTRRKDIKNGEKIEFRKRLHLIYIRELGYLNGDFSCFGDGKEYVDPKHAFTFDMDVFGPDSLFNRINRSVTTGGSMRLAECLSEIPNDINITERRRAAINELAGKEAWRSEFLAAGLRLTPDGNGTEGIIDSKGILNVIKEVSSMDIAPFARGRFPLVVAGLSLTVFFAAILLSVFTPLPSAVPIMWGLIQLFAVLTLTSRPLRDISKAAGRLHSQLKAYVRLINIVCNDDNESEELKGIRHNLYGNSGDALASFGQLSDILKRIDRRANVLGLIIFNIFGLSDFFLVRRFLKWQQTYMERIPLWIDSLSYIDALVSMATFQYNEQDTVTATVTGSPEVVFRAKGLYHPFLGKKAVRNDFSIKDNDYYIITGANMAGKSTFLRAVGINYILAMNGMPVFADELEVSVFRLFSSMRTTDDLSHGISYFNAELIRLRQLMDSCRKPGKTLIILDEILKGTNSLDKLNGSRLFLQEISKMNVTGIIATHDLELSKMEDDCPERFHNWCFEIKLSENITYTYKITRSVARNQNATFLLKRILQQGNAETGNLLIPIRSATFLH